MMPAPTAMPQLHTPNHFLRLSRLLALSCTALMFLLPLLLAGYWSVADTASLAVRAANLTPADIMTILTPWQRIIGALLMEGALLPLLIALYQARRCFVSFTSGQIFTQLAARCLQRFAGWTLISIVVDLVAHVALSVLLTLNNPTGFRHIAVGVGTDQVFTVFFGGMVWMMAAIIGQGQSLAEENNRFI